MSYSPRSSRPVAVPSGRLNRLSRIGTLAAGVAGNMALNGLAQIGRGERPAARDLLLTPGNVQRVADELARMRGAAMKVGQLISMDSGELLPPELADIMARLRADADFMPPKQLKQVLNAELGPDWLRAFSGFDVRPIAAASIGQVHRAHLKDGRDLAIKVQYPGIARSIDSDVVNVGRLIKLSGLMPSGLDLDPYLEEASRQLHEEADYIQEAKHLGAFCDLIGDDPAFALPDIAQEFTTNRVLSMTFVPGERIEAAEALAQETRDGIATHLYRLFLKELFAFRLMQTDPNFANYRYDAESGKVVLLDFGATRALGGDVVAAYRGLIHAGMRSDRDAMIDPAYALGILSGDLAPHHCEMVLQMIELVFSSVTANEVFDFARSDLLRRLQSMGETLAADNVVPPPPPMDVLYVQRKVAGLFLLATRLKARVPLREMLESAVS